MNIIALYAYTNVNLGDDLFIKILCERYPKTKFIIAAPKKYKYIFKDIKNLYIISSDSVLFRGTNFIFRKFGKDYFTNKLLSYFSAGSILIGGSLFEQGEGWEKRIIHLKSMHHKNKPFFLLGANFGPFYDKVFYENHKKLFKEYTDICFRDEYSFNLFKELSNVRKADDIIFQLQSREFKQQKNNIVISIIKPSIRKYLKNYDKIYYKKIRDITVYFIKKGYEVTLISFCGNEGDVQAIEDITNLIPEEYINKVNKHFYKFNIQETLDIIENSSFVVATRFHSMILGWVYNKPVFPIAYSKKMENVIMDVGFKGKYSDIKSIEYLKVEEVFECMKSNMIDVSKQKNNAEGHFKKLDEFLK